MAISLYLFLIPVLYIKLEEDLVPVAIIIFYYGEKRGKVCVTVHIKFTIMCREVLLGPDREKYAIISSSSVESFNVVLILKLQIEKKELRHNF